MALTDRTIKAAKAEGKSRFLADGHGLYLRVQPSGAKTFVRRSRVGGVASWTTLGDYPEMSLAEARRLVVATRPTTKVTLAEAYDQWMVTIRRAYRRPEQVEWRMGKYVLPLLGDRRVDGIKTNELTQLLADLAGRAPVIANRVLADIKRLLAFTVERGWADQNPLARVTTKSVGGRETSRARVLSDSELVKLLCYLQTIRFAPKTRLALALLLLTGQRSGEVRGVVASEMFHGVWRIPPERTKTSSDNQVPMSLPVSLLMRVAFREFGDSPFAGMEPQILPRAMARMKFEPKATPHDLRRTMATWMADNGVPPHVIEKCLNHKMAGVMSIYNRSLYMSEKRVALRRWAIHILRLRRQKEAPGA